MRTTETAMGNLGLKMGNESARITGSGVQKRVESFEIRSLMALANKHRWTICAARYLGDLSLLDQQFCLAAAGKSTQLKILKAAFSVLGRCGSKRTFLRTVLVCCEERGAPSHESRTASPYLDQSSDSTLQDAAAKAPAARNSCHLICIRFDGYEAVSSTLQ
ncbi:hypothetical protein P171DRAFT_142220 [Karstenula rhodostoma CBS 690.94]|uniref:Uncharacterized protein n=1 Tax=Karstenula rhodostoma CBS 690.94 TaxID=1392251 RepID=A0A9P4PUQ5_9PLEO|nr:hypothetical protein P171DRAFT_142220 [Karstenula rhodostoma CBS 690.94]